jgi:hypothetical protein
VNRAIILIDDDERDDGRAAECFEQTRRRGYRLIASLRDWDRALELLRRRIISIIVFPGRTDRRRGPGPATEDTVALTIRMPAPRAVGRRSVPAPEWVRELIGNGAVMPSDAVGARIYETARIMPRGDDGGFAEQFLRGRRDS